MSPLQTENLEKIIKIWSLLAKIKPELIENRLIYQLSGESEKDTRFS